MEKPTLADLLDELPPIIGRTEVSRLTGGLIHPRTLANHDSAGTGPRRIKLGRKIGYFRNDFVAWLTSRLVAEEP